MADLLAGLKDLDRWVTDWLAQIHQDRPDAERLQLADDMASEWFSSGMGASFRDQIAEAEKQRVALHRRNARDMLASANHLAPSKDEDGGQEHG